ncbi:histidine N-alpha-methyltransferase [Paractinoplanes abujensis]|uniref:Histidine N-alpha-methyltransferase n=1 Tax=Paractinoplanes abujensis TaxID=882441 RepID=A0A7W7CMV0_9ACTN|nr:L-histidine N(alpha)-methyltransferase [Actinoplanes abujensis]MBB4691189.1 L-histidine N-alpha-methyltransferase [Actinoplanes abujensis]GID17394.1 histidine N-alpha-methyltransferase [Actinoplanes abujensis]
MKVLLDADVQENALRADVVAGLTAARKWLPPKWFYDARGSELFEQITELPEYYPTRTERAILTSYAPEVARLTGARTLIELGAGYSTKTRLLLQALPLTAFVPVDVSPSALAAAAEQIGADFPALRVHPIVGDFTRHLGAVPDTPGRLVAFLGGTIGNFEPAARARFFADLRAVLRPGEHLLLGTDLVKSPRELVPAYDDAAGVTAEFNKNVLRVLNRHLDADFDVDGFAHVALWDAAEEWIEMRLRARWPMRVTIPAVGLVVEFAPGEEIRTEISAKFRREGVEKELSEAGFALDQWWTDDGGRFALSLARAVA